MSFRDYIVEWRHGAHMDNISRVAEVFDLDDGALVELWSRHSRGIDSNRYGLRDRVRDSIDVEAIMSSRGFSRFRATRLVSQAIDALCKGDDALAAELVGEGADA